MNLLQVCPLKGLLSRLAGLALVLGLPTLSVAAADVTYPAYPARFHHPLGMDFVLIPAGPVRFGYIPALPGQSGPALPSQSNPAQTDYIVWLKRPYYLQTTELTRGQWQALMGNLPCEPQTVCEPEPANLPVRGVTVSEVQQFLQRLNHNSSAVYRLPTRPEWEHAARAGSWHSRYWWGDDPRYLSTYDNCLAAGDQGLAWPGLPGDGYRGLAPVAQFRPNPWGLYDMQGNLSELLAHASSLWPGYRLDPTRHFVEAPLSYLRQYTDFPQDHFPADPYRDAAGGNYRQSPAACDLSSGSALLQDGLQSDPADQQRQTRSDTVGFRLLLEAESLTLAP